MGVFTLGGRQRQWHRHGMGWIPICDGNGNPFDCMHFAIAIAADTPPSVNTCNDSVAVAVAQCERTFTFEVLANVDVDVEFR